MLTIVAIGKNEENNIKELHKSIQILCNSVDIKIQTIYVDSSSTDRSFELAKTLFDECYKIEKSPFNSASAGRFIGTLKAKYSWILYVDGDMEFLDDIKKLINSINNVNVPYIGFIGNYVNTTNNGNVTVFKYCQNNRSIYTEMIGGCVILNRDIVLKAGNWNPSIYSCEENDLYMRMKKYGNLIYYDISMVKHKTQSYSKLENLKRIIFPGGGLGNKYYGLGQSLMSAIMNRYIMKYIYFYRRLFFYIFGNIVGVVLMIKDFEAGLFIVGIVNLFIIGLFGLGKPLYYFAQLFQILNGIWKYNNNYYPTIVDLYIIHE